MERLRRAVFEQVAKRADEGAKVQLLETIVAAESSEAIGPSHVPMGTRPLPLPTPVRDHICTITGCHHASLVSLSRRESTSHHITPVKHVENMVFSPANNC